MAGKADLMTPWIPGALVILDDAGKQNPYTGLHPRLKTIEEAIAFTSLVVKVTRSMDSILQRIMRQSSA